MKKIIIAIDGESSSGKSTLAKDLAKKISYKHINTGSMYRAVTWVSLQAGLLKDCSVIEASVPKFIDLNTDFQKDSIVKLTNNLDFNFKLINGNSNLFLDGVNVEEKIRSIEVSNFVSQVSTIVKVREKIVDIQRQIGAKKGIVMEGRDIGSVVFPDAELKLFITANINVRASRRFNELREKGLKIDKKLVFKNLQKRDFLDKNRSISPLLKVEDAITIDNSTLTINDQISIIQNYIRKIT